MQWCLGGGRMGQKSPVEDNHVQETRRWLAVLQMSHSLCQRLGSFGRHLVAEEGDLRCSEDALRWVDYDPVLLKLLEKFPQMNLVLLWRSGEYEDNVQVRETDVKSPQNVVHKPLESLGGIA